MYHQEKGWRSVFFLEDNRLQWVFNDRPAGGDGSEIRGEQHLFLLEQKYAGVGER